MLSIVQPSAGFCILVSWRAIKFIKISYSLSFALQSSYIEALTEQLIFGDLQEIIPKMQLQFQALNNVQRVDMIINISVYVRVISIKEISCRDSVMKIIIEYNVVGRLIQNESSAGSTDP